MDATNTRWVVSTNDRDAQGRILVQAVERAEGVDDAPETVEAATEGAVVSAPTPRYDDALPTGTRTSQAALFGASEPARPPIRGYQIGVFVLVLASIGLVAFVVGRLGETSAPHEAQSAATALSTIAGPTALPAPTAAPTPAPTALALLAFFDYRDPASSTPLSSSQIARVVAKAGDDWRQVALTNSDARPWLRAQDVPAGVSAADPLPDLAPRPTPIPPPPPVYSAPVADPPVAAPIIVPTIDEHGRPYYTPEPKERMPGRSK